MVVKDAAAGIAAGVREVFPEAEQRDDCFHALYEMNKVRRCLERRAYGAIGREIEALSRLGTIRAHHICCQPDYLTGYFPIYVVMGGHRFPRLRHR